MLDRDNYEEVIKKWPVSRAMNLTVVQLITYKHCYGFSC
jgi:hypothetical protein